MQAGVRNTTRGLGRSRLQQTMRGKEMGTMFFNMMNWRRCEGRDEQRDEHNKEHEQEERLTPEEMTELQLVRRMLDTLVQRF